MDQLLRKKLLNRFYSFEKKTGSDFLRLDHRICLSPDDHSGSTLSTIQHLGMAPADICFVLQMDPGVITDRDVVHILDRYRSQGFRTAVAGFDIRFHGVQLLDRMTPDYLILCRNLYSDFTQKAKTQQIISFMLTYAHLMECRVIAGEVQTDEEFIQCREWGCDLIQGDVVQRPVAAWMPSSPVMIPSDR